MEDADNLSVALQFIYTAGLSTCTLATVAVSLWGHWSRCTGDWRRDEPHHHIAYILVTPTATRLLHCADLAWPRGWHVLAVQYGCDVLDWLALYHLYQLGCCYFYREASVTLQPHFPFHHRDKCVVDRAYVDGRTTAMFLHHQERHWGKLTWLTLYPSIIALWVLLVWRLFSFSVALMVVLLQHRRRYDEMTPWISMQRIVDTTLLLLLTLCMALQLFSIRDDVSRYGLASKLALLVGTLLWLSALSWIWPATDDPRLLHYNAVSLTLWVAALLNHAAYPPVVAHPYRGQYETNALKPVPRTKTPRFIESDSSDSDSNLVVDIDDGL
jgi:hypothetical protein